ncbi:transposase [Acidisoma sp. L85]|uniref:transposase n=1 Tax=Acidisoma sp. L85 TaxID=1641850 RepID=UPI0020B16DFB|nr:transposase [Acidisoma sp. L85]
MYDTLYCARGQAENLIKMHKGQLAPDRTSYRSPMANQMRLILHTAAYWQLLTLRDALSAPQVLHARNWRSPLAPAQYRGTGHRTACHVRIAFAAACAEAASFRGVANALTL